MLTRISGTLESLDAPEAVLRLESGLWYQVLVPVYEAERLRARVGKDVTLHTIHYLESHGQGSSYIPRLIGFSTPADRRFFELLTTVDGLGNRKALRALAQEPALVARAILGADAAWLSKLPEIGKKTAEKVILELKTKVQPFLTADEIRGLDTAASSAPEAISSPMEEAIATLVALGEGRADAERMVRLAVSRNRALATTDQIVSAAVGR